MAIKLPVWGSITHGDNWETWQRMGHAISEEMKSLCNYSETLFIIFEG